MEKKDKSKKKPNKNGTGVSGKSGGSKKPDMPTTITEPKGFSKGKPKEKTPKNEKKSSEKSEPIKILSKPQKCDEPIRSSNRSNRNSFSNEHSWETNPDYHQTSKPRKEKMIDSKICDTSSQFSKNTVTTNVMEENLSRFVISNIVDQEEDIDLDVEGKDEMLIKKQVPVMCLDDEKENVDVGDEFMVRHPIHLKVTVLLQSHKSLSYYSLHISQKF